MNRNFTIDNMTEFLFVCFVRNGTIFILKVIVWRFTGSHSMFAESIHSVADTANQIILAFGIHRSIKVIPYQTSGPGDIFIRKKNHFFVESKSKASVRLLKHAIHIVTDIRRCYLLCK